MSCSLQLPRPVSSVRRQVRPVEHADARNLEADLGTAEQACRVRLAEEVARGVTVGAAPEVHQVFAALDARPGRPPPRARSRSAAPRPRSRSPSSPARARARCARRYPCQLPFRLSIRCANMAEANNPDRRRAGAASLRRTAAKLHLNRMFDWNDLRYFLAVAREGSTIAAADMLKVNQSTVQRRLAALEEELERKLVERFRTGYCLTATGLALRPHAEAVEAAIAAFERELSAARPRAQRHHPRDRRGGPRLPDPHPARGGLPVRASRRSGRGDHDRAEARSCPG